MHAYTRLDGFPSATPPGSPSLPHTSFSSLLPWSTSRTSSLSSLFSKPLTLRESLIAFTSFVLTLLLVQSLDVDHYDYAALPKQILYKFKGIPMGPVETLLVFGDSYSDNCNLWRLNAPLKEQKKYPFPTCPPPPVGRSNGGQTWPELIQRDTGVEVLNFAHSASTCSNELIGVGYHNPITDEEEALPATKEQMELFRATGKVFIPANTVAVIFGGTNDIAAILAVMRDDDKQDPHRTLATTADEAQCTMDRVQQIYDLGIRRIVVMSNIPLERTPLFTHDIIGDGTTQDGAKISKMVAGLVADNNSQQKALLPKLQGKLYDAEVQIFDTYALFTELFDDPIPTYGKKFNLDSWCHYCLTGECHLCKKPDTYMFMDDLHPTQRTHEVIAKRLAAFIGLRYPA